MTRRELLARTGYGFGTGRTGRHAGRRRNQSAAPKAPPLPAKAKSVIYLFMHGGVSHVDTFDPKPELTRYTGKPLSVELAKTIKTSFIHDPTKAILRGSPWEFKPGGKCGTPVSDLYPNVRDVWTTSRWCAAAIGPVRSRARDLPAEHRSQFPAGRASAPGSLTGWARRTRICRRSS